MPVIGTDPLAIDYADVGGIAAVVFVLACMAFGLGIQFGAAAWRRYERRSWRRVR